LFFDSLGSEAQFGDLLEELSNDLISENITIYAVNEHWQSSSKGCIAGSLVLAREATGTKNGLYYLPDLLDYLETHSTKMTHSELREVTKLPPELLIVSQRSTFLNKYQEPEKANEIVHKELTFAAGQGRSKTEACSPWEP